MKVYKIRNKASGEYYSPKQYGFVKRTGKIYYMKACAFLAGKRWTKRILGLKLEVVEFDLVEVKAEIV